MQEDIDRLVEALNDTAATDALKQQAPSRLQAWLRTLVARGGSDLFLVAGAPPSLRIDGAVHPLEEGPLDGQDVEDAVLPALSPYHVKGTGIIIPLTCHCASTRGTVFASTFTASASARQPPSARCRPRSPRSHR
jgi:hypothetical protein